MIKIEINQRVGRKLDKKWISKIVELVFKSVKVKNAEISLAFVGDAEIKKLNNFYRGKNKTTDVLSFIYESKVGGGVEGEIIISYPQAVRQAKEQKHAALEEIKMLLIHGVLHLAGYDHEKSLREARRMENLQNKMVKLLDG